MKTVAFAITLATSIAFSASAMTAEIDIDGDGKASLSELLVAYPDLTKELFHEMDSDGDGFINDEEMAIAIELGNLADPETDA